MVKHQNFEKILMQNLKISGAQRASEERYFGTLRVEKSLTPSTLTLLATRLSGNLFYHKLDAENFFI